LLVQVRVANVPLRAMALVPMASLRRLEVGQPVLLAVEGCPPSRFGMLVGTVSSVGLSPVTLAALRQLFDDPRLAGDLADRLPAAALVNVDLAESRDGRPLWTLPGE